MILWLARFTAPGACRSSGTTDMASAPTDPNQSLSKALSIISTLHARQGDMGIREISRALSMPPAVVHRMMATLRNHRFVEQDPRTSRYRVGLKLFEVGQSYLTQYTLSDIAFAELTDAARTHGLSGYLGVMNEEAVVYLLSVPALASVYYAPPGLRAYLHSTALGKIALSSISGDALDALLVDLPMPRLTGTTITTAERLREEVNTVRETGIATCFGENIADVFAIGVPIRDAQGEIIAAMSLASFDPAHFQRTREAISEHLLAGAARIEEQLARPTRPARPVCRVPRPQH